MSTIIVIKIKNYLNWSIFELGAEFVFFTLHCSYIVGQYEYKNALVLAFYSPYPKGCFFCSLEKSPWYVPAKYSETNNTEQCPRRNEKYISSIFISRLIFAFPQISYFHIIFTILVLAQIQRIICWGKRI